MNDSPLFVLLESNPPSASEFLSVKLLLKDNPKVTIAIVDDDSLMLTDKRVEMWLAMFEGYPPAHNGLDVIVIPNDFLSNMACLQKIKKGYKRIAVKDKRHYVFFATKGYNMTPLPFVPGYEQIFLANAYRQSIAYRFLENYKR